MLLASGVMVMCYAELEKRRSMTSPSSETLLETALTSRGCRRVFVALLDATALVILTIILILSFVPAWEGVGDAALHPLALLADTTQPTTLYVGTEQGGVMVSRDAGASWATYHTGLPANTVVAALLALPGTGHLLCGTDQGLFASRDGGRTWAAQGSGLPTGMTVDALASVTPDARTLLAGGTAGLFRSTDGGATWASAASGLPSGSAIYGLEATPSRIFAALIPGGVYASTDGGATWQPSAQGLPASVNAFAVISTPSRVFVGTNEGIFASTDGGATWVQRSAGLGTTNRAISLAVDPRVPIDLIAGTDRGVFRSTDGGATWAPFGDLPTPPGQSVGAVLLVRPPGGNLTYYAAADRLYRFPQAPNGTRQTWQWLGILADLALLVGLALLGVRFLRTERAGAVGDSTSD
jgi:photosystem II stability/assembly factor-like uncharacterized protein